MIGERTIRKLAAANVRNVAVESGKVVEILIALAISATTNPIAALALEQLPKLKGCEAHSTVIVSEVDSNVYRKLGLNLTCEPIYATKKLYHK